MEIRYEIVSDMDEFRRLICVLSAFMIFGDKYIFGSFLLEYALNGHQNDDMPCFERFICIHRLIQQSRYNSAFSLTEVSVDL